MAVVDHQSLDATAQLIEFAERGRLVAPGVERGRLVSGLAPLPVIIVASIVIGLGIAVTGSGLISGTAIFAVVGTGVTCASTALLILAINALGSRHRTDHAVDIQAAAIVLPRQVKSGMWIRHDGAWARVDDTGVAQGGSLTALLSTGDIIDLSHPVTLAGGPFQPLENQGGSSR